jgi:hypothetical protein
MIARRMILILIAMTVLAGACARAVPAGGSGSPVSGDDPVDQRVVDVYAAAIRALVATERWFDPVLIDDRICEEAGDPMGGDDSCLRRFTDAEQGALLVKLSDLPHVEFVADGDAVQRQIFAGKIHGAGLIAVGPIAGSGDRVEVPGEAYCGGLCGHWMTLVVEREPDGWSVSGTTGPVAIS